MNLHSETVREFGKFGGCVSAGVTRPSNCNAVNERVYTMVLQTYLLVGRVHADVAANLTPYTHQRHSAEIDRLSSN